MEKKRRPLTLKEKMLWLNVMVFSFLIFMVVFNFLILEIFERLPKGRTKNTSGLPDIPVSQALLFFDMVVGLTASLIYGFLGLSWEAEKGRNFQIGFGILALVTIVLIVALSV